MSGVAPGQARAAGFWTVVWLLLAASYRRAVGRRRRQQQLFRQRAAKKVRNWSGAGFLLLAAALTVVHVLAGFLVLGAVLGGERLDAERHGWVVVDQRFIDRVAQTGGAHMGSAFHNESAHIAQLYGGTAFGVEQRLREEVRAHGTGHLMAVSVASPGFRGLPTQGPLPGLLGLMVVAVWFAMLACQGEGLELDIQRRRHPMWEWLFSHPVPSGAVFLAEMLAPIAANPVYFGAPVFAGIVYGLVYGWQWGVLAAVLAGVPLTVAAACFGKALEIGVTLRFAPRSRGAMIGVMGWLGYVTMMGLVFAGATFGKVFLILGDWVRPLASVPWPWLGMFLGARPDGSFSLAWGVAACWAFATMVIAGSVQFSMWGAQRGLAAPGGVVAAGGRVARGRGAGFGADGLYRKEILWFLRDRSALVQAVLIPVTMAGFQMFNMRNVLATVNRDWNTLCGGAIIFGTYFLLVLGPKSLASEGAAVWLSLTWPQGLEKLLRAKAWLWTVLSSVVVGAVMIYDMVLFPGSAWKVALVAVAWFLFARSMAAKTVTLATITSESGEIQKVPLGRRTAAQLGLLTFSIGVLTQQWNLAVMGVVYSIMTAAAMWQNFRARLPYLYDPWSEVLPTPPTLMHAMVAISALVEVGAVLTGGALVFFKADQVAMAHAVVYGLCASVVAVFVANFLRKRGVRLGDIVNWRPVGLGGAWWDLASGAGRVPLVWALGLGAAAGVVLGVVGIGYVMGVELVPGGAAQMAEAAARMAAIPHMREALFVMAVVIAPCAEEFLFRGLLYRALDREWGGWRAVLGSAAFFAVYHPMLSWVPVGLLGVVNAVIFKKTGRLAPAIVTHMVYNAIVLA
jgi:membrane protease YdiL (CAAX protease family)